MLPKGLSLPAGLVSGTVDGGAIGRYVALCLQAVTGAKGRDQVKMPLLPRVSNLPVFNGERACRWSRELLALHYNNTCCVCLSICLQVPSSAFERRASRAE